MLRNPEPTPGYRCLCSTVRRAGRLLTRQYENALQPSGMSVSQFELMNTVRTMQPVDQSRLAKQMEVDQTTLSRTVRPLLALGWISSAAPTGDGRKRSYQVSAEGAKALKEATRCWRKVHDRMEAKLGLSELWPMLDRILDVGREVS